MSENQITLVVIITYLVTVWIAYVRLTYEGDCDEDFRWFVALFCPVLLAFVPIFYFFKSASSFARWLKKKEPK